MKKGPIIAIVVSVAVVTAVYLAERAPKSPMNQEASNNQTEAETEADPLDAKVAEAVEIIQSGTGSPMAGVQLLREVVAEDSNHIGANFWLGEFSMMSGQHEKAIPRYAKILRLQPDNLEVCLKLARAYQANGQIEQASGVLNAYLATHPDEKTKEQIMPVLNELSVNS